jgi:putative membrane protein
MKATNFVVAAAASMLLWACASTTTMDANGQPMASSTGSMAGMSGMNNMNGMAMGMSESDIAAIVTAANEGEIQQGQTAASQATNADVRAFAQMMVTDHTNALNMGRDVFSRRNITPSDNDISRTLRSGSQQTVSALTTYTGSSFDRTYMQSQVDLHQWLLNTLDTNLIPSAHSTDVRNLLQTQRASVAMHLEHARTLLGRM